jgi:hypothetical protein
MNPPTKDTYAPWIQTRSGRALDLLDPRPDQIYAYDIAVALSRIPRFCGHTSTRLAYSVAQHSVYTVGMLPPHASPMLKLHTLLHDAHEFATGDISTPVKMALRATGGGDALVALQRRIQWAVNVACGAPWATLANNRAISDADGLSLAAEFAGLMGPPPRPWPGLADVANIGGWPTPAPAHVARDSFMFCLRRLVVEAGVTPLRSFIDPPESIDV